MPLPTYGNVGPDQVSDGVSNPIRLGRMSDLVTSDLTPRYGEATLRGTAFIAANVAATAVSVALATTYTGLCLSNPLGNTKALVLESVGMALSVAPAGIASLHLIGGFNPAANVTHTTPLAAPGIQNAALGRAEQSSAKCDSAATVANAGYLMALCNGFTAAALPNNMVPLVDIAGQICIFPGAWVAVGALTAVTGFFSFTWQEIPI